MPVPPVTASTTTSLSAAALFVGSESTVPTGGATVAVFVTIRSTAWSGVSDPTTSAVTV